MTKTKREMVNIIRRHSKYIINAANLMHDSGERVNTVTVYHDIKRQLGLPVCYDLNLGAEIRSILKEAEWITEAEENA